MFRTTARLLKFAPENGQRVVARGRISVYAAKGEYQIVCDALEPQGLGALQLAFEQLKRRLTAEGLFDAARKRALPILPRRIGVVTSLDGAALRDILRVLTVRHPTARVVIRPARVQGDDAPADLVRALTAIARVPEVDVVIIGRGGGSMEDLWAFNDEHLARAIAACPVPVISAVGHEVDFTIADFVADLRAATPSNAAELVVDRTDNFRTRIDRADRSAAPRCALARRPAPRERARADVRLRRTGRRRSCCASATATSCRFGSPRAIARRVSRGAERFEALRRRLERRDVRRVDADLAHAARRRRRPAARADQRAAQRGRRRGRATARRALARAQPARRTRSRLRGLLE